MLAGFLAAVVFSTQFVWSGLAARRSRSEQINPQVTSLEKLPPIATSGPVLATIPAVRYSAFQAAPFQGCTINCTATVPETGASGVGIPFQATAPTTGCTTQPSYQWSFGDGTPNSSEQNPSHTYASAGSYTWTLTTTVSSGSTMIDTVAGGLGEGNPARQAPFRTLAAITRDPQNRGVYVVDTDSSLTLIRFVNTGNAAVTVAGVTIAPGTVRAIAGGGLDLGDNVPALSAELGAVTGLAASADGNLLFFIAQQDAAVRAVNVSGSSQTVGGQTVAAGRVGTLAGNLGTSLSGIAVQASTGDVFICDASADINKVFRINPQGQSAAFAGNSATTKATDAFSAGAALSIPLLQPRGVKVEDNGSVLIADTGHGRVIRVTGGAASLVRQFTINDDTVNPYPTGLALFGGNAYTATGNEQTVYRITGGSALIAGTVANGKGVSCDYSASNCGDGGPASGSGFNLLGSTGTPPLAGIESDANGLFVLDQGVSGRGRIRYINLTGGTVNVAGTNVPAGAIETIGGTGQSGPYDGGLATGATFNTPTGVAVDGNGNLWITDTISAKIRFVNRGGAPTTIFAGTPAQQAVPAGGIVTVNKDVGGGAGDGVPVNQGAFDSPQGLFITSQGIYVADSRSGPAVPPQTFNSRRTSLIRFINTTNGNVTLFGGSASPIVVQPGHVAKIAGGGENANSNGDGGFATSAKFIGASDLVVTANGTIYVTDVGQKAVRRIDGSTGVASSVGNLGSKQFTGVGLDGQGRLHIANFDDGTVVRENTAGSGTFTTIATGLNKPRDVAVTSDGTAYVTVGLTRIGAGAVNNHQIVQIPPGGAATVLGGSVAGFSGDGGPISGALFNMSPSALVVGPGTENQLPQTVNITSNGAEVLFTDSNNNRVRRISPSVTTCTKTGTITIQGNNPTPVIAELNPAGANQNSGALTLTVNGTGFIPASVVRWKGEDRATTFVNATQVTAQITATDTLVAGAAAVTVFNPAPGGGASNAANFNVIAPNPVPAVTAINPNTAMEGSAAFTISVTGNNFVNGAVVRWDGGNRQTTFVSPTQLTAQILASDLVGPGVAAVTIFNPTPGGGVSNAVNFTITSNQNPLPALTNMTPSSASAGAAQFNLSLMGNNFVSGSKVRWNTTIELATTVVGATQLTAVVPANLVAAAGTAQVSVFNPMPGGGSSAPLTFTINPLNANNPTIVSLNPGSVATGGPGFNLGVSGTNFVSGSRVRIGNTERATTFVGSTQLTAAILASDIAAAGSFDITVVNPGVATPSNAVKLTVAAPVASVSAASFLGQSIAADSIVAAFGSGLATGVEVASSTPLPTTLLGTTVKVKDAAGTERTAPLFFVAPTQINYLVPTGTGDGVATVTVTLNNTVVGIGTLTIAKVAPGLISQNSNGAGVAAAVALRIRGNAQTFDPVAMLQGGAFVPAPIDLGPEGDIVYLLLYGTGIRARSSAGGISVRLGDVTKTLSSANFEDGFAAPGFFGLDQVNVVLPRTLIGKGTMDVVLTVDGKVANTVQIAIK
jgi:uncharacterized protein (TIGR03437 family)